MTETKDIWQFPCDFPIKVMGKAAPEFETFVLATIRKHVTNITEDAIELRSSENKNYVSITVTIQAQSKAQLDTIYQELTASDLVLMTL